MKPAAASLLAFVWVLMIGELASFPDTYSRTAYAFGIATGVPMFLLADKLLVSRRRG